VCSSDLLSDFNELGISGKTSEKYSHIKFNENSFNGSRFVPCGQTDGRTDMKKLVVAFRNFSDSPKIDDVSDKLVLFTFSGGKEYEEITTAGTASHTADTNTFLDIVSARKLQQTVFFLNFLIFHGAALMLHSENKTNHCV
jgi:hypothetical protein